MAAIINEIGKPSNSHKIDFVKISTKSKTYDVTDLFLTFIVFEDLRGGSVDAEIILIDSNDILSSIPVQGREEMSISFSSRDSDGKFTTPYIKNFIVTGSEDYIRDQVSQTTTVKLNLVEKSHFLQRQIRISKSFNDIPNNIVTKLCNLVNIIPDTEQCLFKRPFIVPNINPFDFITYLTSESTSKQNKSSDFCFFENKDGYNFKSVYTLMKKPASHNFTYYLEDYGVDTDLYDPFNVEEYICDEPFNIMNQLDGALGSTILTHDLIRKKIISNSSDYYKYLELFSSMNNGGLYVDDTVAQNVNTNIMYDINDTVYANNELDTLNQRIKKNINKLLLESSPSTFVMAGNTEIKTGQTFNFEYTTKGEPDIFRSGKHLIDAIKHQVTRNDYTMTISAVKDSNIKTSKKL